MKKLNQLLLGLLLVGSAIACHRETSLEERDIVIDLSVSNPYLPMSVLVDTIESVRLQLPSPYFWGMVDNVISKDSCYYISDRKQEMAFRFSKNGTFLNAIGQRGVILID